MTPEDATRAARDPAPRIVSHDATPFPPPPMRPAGVDPKQAAGAAKVPLSVLPAAVVLEAGAALGEGAVKYGPHNWRTSGGVVASTYINGCLRHLLAFAMGEDIDPDTTAPDGSGGLSHLAKLIASAMVLRDAQLHGVAHDDRPPPSPPELIRHITAAYCGLIPRAEAARDNLKGPPHA